jgi:hypothetical protein
MPGIAAMAWLTVIVLVSFAASASAAVTPRDVTLYLNDVVVDPYAPWSSSSSSSSTGISLAEVAENRQQLYNEWLDRLIWHGMADVSKNFGVTQLKRNIRLFDMTLTAPRLSGNRTTAIFPAQEFGNASVTDDLIMERPYSWEELGNSLASTRIWLLFVGEGLQLFYLLLFGLVPLALQRLLPL